MQVNILSGLEQKFCRADQQITVTDGSKIEGYASLFGQVDQGGDVIAPGAYAVSLKHLQSKGRAVKLLWQHDPAQPIGIWDEVREDDKGLYVKGRLLSDVTKGREAASLIEAGAIDGLSIGYRAVKASKDSAGHRVLNEVELWEVSLVTFPMLPDARVGAKSDEAPSGILQDLADVISQARRALS